MAAATEAKQHAGKPGTKEERTFIAIKPDGVQVRLAACGPWGSGPRWQAEPSHFALVCVRVCADARVRSVALWAT